MIYITILRTKQIIYIMFKYINYLNNQIVFLILFYILNKLNFVINIDG